MRERKGARAQWSFQWRGGGMENVLRMHLRARCYARLIDLFNAKEMKGFRCCQNRLMMSKGHQSLFAAGRRGRGACATRGSSGQGTGIRHIACKMSVLAFDDSKCTFERGFPSFHAHVMAVAE